MDIRHFASLPSTQEEAIRLAREGRDAVAVWADEQTDGRGRMGRAWTSPPGNLYLSVVARPVLPAALSGRLGVSCGVAVARALGLRTKWPNDIYLNGRKVAGMLVETRLAPGGALTWAVVGLGVNVASHPDVAPPGHPATCLAEHGLSRPVAELAALLAPVLHAACLAAASPDWQAGWCEVDLACGPVRLLEAGAEWVGVGEGLADDGALLVRAKGTLRRVTAGEVSVRV